MPLIPDEVGAVYDAGIISPTYGSFGITIKPGTFKKDLQSQLRDDVISGLTIAVGDRDLAFWKRQSQFDWSQGEGQEYFSNPSRYSKSSSLDVHTPGMLRLVPQPTQLRAATAALNGRGAVLAKQTAFFPWINGQYSYVTNNLVSNLAVTGLGGSIGDIATDGTTVFFAEYTTAGIWSTPAAAPGALGAYDASVSLWGRLAYDQLNKRLYAATSALTGLARVDKINAGGVSTTIYDFVTGRLDALEMHQGNLIIAWNDGQGALDGPVPTVGAFGRSRLFKYDGTNVTTFVDLPDGCLCVGLRSALGVLFVEVEENDPLDVQNSPPANIFAGYSVSGSTLTRLGTITGTNASDSGTNLVYIGSHSMAVNAGTSVYFPASGFCWRYDTELGGFSRSLGDDVVPGLVNTGIAAIMSSVVLMPGGGVLCEYGGGRSDGGIYNLNGTIFGIRPSLPSFPTAKMTGSRMDAGLPYVGKYWYVIECIFTALLANESVEMEFSLDDGATYATCANSPAVTAGQTQASFTVQLTNPHIRYRVRPVADPGVTKGPTIYSVSCRYAVLNPSASVYRFSASCVDNIRFRNNQVVPAGYGKDALAFFDNIARENKTVTFYEPDDSTRTPHTCWVVSLSRPMPNTSSVYNPNKAEGDADIVLWETV